MKQADDTGSLYVFISFQLLYWNDSCGTQPITVSPSNNTKICHFVQSAVTRCVLILRHFNSSHLSVYRIHHQTFMCPHQLTTETTVKLPVIFRNALVPTLGGKNAENWLGVSSSATPSFSESRRSSFVISNSPDMSFTAWTHIKLKQPSLSFVSAMNLQRSIVVAKEQKKQLQRNQLAKRFFNDPVLTIPNSRSIVTSALSSFNQEDDLIDKSDATEDLNTSVRPLLKFSLLI